MRLYVAGPMTGIRYFNFPAFDEAERMLKSLGITAWSPAAHDREEGLNEKNYPTGSVEELNKRMPGHMPNMMRWDLDRILNAEGILRLPGWENSKGAALELAVNRAVNGRVFDVVAGVAGPSGVLPDGVKPHMVGIAEVFDV